jgi:uncharacterized membrane protein
LILSTALGTAVTLALLAVPWRTPTRVLLGWDAGVALYLALTYGVMANASIAKIRQRAAIVDEGALAVLVLTTAAALASLVAVLAELGHAPDLSQIALGMGTILLSWVFMHSIFALHYAHEFYGEGGDHRTGGLVSSSARLSKRADRMATRLATLLPCVLVMSSPLRPQCSRPPHTEAALRKAA